MALPARGLQVVCRKKDFTGGFTLIEVLIALAITGMVVSVLMSSVFYGAKVQTGIRQELVDREQLLRGKAWFAEVLSACLPADAASGSAFEGAPQQIICDTLMPLQGGKVLGAQRIKVALKGGSGQALQLVYSPVSSKAEPVVLSELPFSEGQFSYIGVNGKSAAKWPLQINDLETLPARIELNLKDSNNAASLALWTVSLRATPWVEPKARLPFGSSTLQ
jgi:prepilin-type N-terminal cleavage/methylation domain-containing protein